MLNTQNTEMCLKRVNWRQHAYSILLLLVVLVSNSNQQRQISTPQPFRHSKIVGDDGFVPIVQPTNNNEPKESDRVGEDQRTEHVNMKLIPTVIPPIDKSVVSNERKSEDQSLTVSLRELRNLVSDFMAIESELREGAIQKRSADGRAITDYLFDGKLIGRIQKFVDKYIFPVARTAALPALTSLVPTGARLFLFKGLKKWFGPIFIGVQIAKTVLLAMFLPSIIGSLGKMVGKGLVSSSGFGHPSETVEDFEFKDNPPADEPATTGIGYNYPQQSLTANHANVQGGFGDTAPAANSMLSLYDIAEPKPQFTLAITYPMPEYPQHSRKETLQSKKDDFKVFHDIPASSMLLTNYDPFYSPLLSRLDAVFHQLNLDGDNEACREKLVCLMYASPAKYMPYSNLVSAQLSRELNELRKPTSDNVEILRFFKYMRAARDGQDGKNCHNMHKKCSSFDDTEQPAMLTTFNDINKLVQARKMQ